MSEAKCPNCGAVGPLVQALVHKADFGVQHGIDSYECVQNQLTQAKDKSEKLRHALQILLDHYLLCANSGDCGQWEPEDEDEVKLARAALGDQQGVALAPVAKAKDEAIAALVEIANKYHKGLCKGYINDTMEDDNLKMTEAAIRKARAALTGGEGEGAFRR